MALGSRRQCAWAAARTVRGCPSTCDVGPWASVPTRASLCRALVRTLAQHCSRVPSLNIALECAWVLLLRAAARHVYVCVNVCVNVCGARRSFLVIAPDADHRVCTIWRPVAAPSWHVTGVLGALGGHDRPETGRSSRPNGGAGGWWRPGWLGGGGTGTCGSGQRRRGRHLERGDRCSGVTSGCSRGVRGWLRMATVRPLACDETAHAPRCSAHSLPPPHRTGTSTSMRVTMGGGCASPCHGSSALRAPLPRT